MCRMRAAATSRCTVAEGHVRPVRSDAAGRDWKTVGMQTLTSEGRHAHKSAGSSCVVIQLTDQSKAEEQLHYVTCTAPEAHRRWHRSLARPLKWEQQGSSVHLCYLRFQQGCIRREGFYTDGTDAPPECGAQTCARTL